MTQQPNSDIIDRLVAIEPGSRLDQIRAVRPQARENTQKSYLALFQPGDFGGFPLTERLAVAAFVAGVHREPASTAFYAAEINSSEPDLADIVAQEAKRGAVQGPYGHYPAGPLSSEDKPGVAYRVEDSHRKRLGERLAAGLEHAHLLVFHPRDASQEALSALLKAGWSTTDIVTLSQLVAYLSFQIRVVAGLRELAASF
jgi:CMD domain protein